MLIDQTSPLFDAQLSFYQRARALYEGGDAIEKNKDYLPRHPFETDLHYAVRFKRATYRNFAAPIADTFASAVVSGVNNREVPPSLEIFLTNADRAGTSAKMFFETVVFAAAGVGLEYVLIDMPPTMGSQSLADDERMGRRPYFVRLSAESIIDWSTDGTGKLEWAVVSQEVYKSREPFVQPEKVKITTLWTRTAWRRFEDGDEVDMGEHNLGIVPIVPFYFEKTEQMVGFSAFDNVASLIKRVYWRDSELDNAANMSAIPMLFFCGFKKDEVADIISAPGNSIYNPDGTTDVNWVEPSGAAVNALAMLIDKDISSIQEISLRQNRPQSAQVESAKAKEIDNKQLETLLRSFATQCSNSEAMCWEIAGKWLGMPDVVVETPYNEDYSVLSENIEKLRTFFELQRSGGISWQTIYEQESFRRVFGEVDHAEELTRLAQQAAVTPLSLPANPFTI